MSEDDTSLNIRMTCGEQWIDVAPDGEAGEYVRLQIFPDTAGEPKKTLWVIMTHTEARILKGIIDAVATGPE